MNEINPFRCAACGVYNCRCGCGLTVSACGTVLTKEQHDHWWKHNQVIYLVSCGSYVERYWNPTHVYS